MFYKINQSQNHFKNASKTFHCFTLENRARTVIMKIVDEVKFNVFVIL